MGRQGTHCHLSKPSPPQMTMFWPSEGDAKPPFPAHGPFPVPCAPLRAPTPGVGLLLSTRRQVKSSAAHCEHAPGPEVRGQNQRTYEEPKAEKSQDKF